MMSWKSGAITTILGVVAWVCITTPHQGLSQTGGLPNTRSSAVQVLSAMLPNGIQQIIVVDTDVKSMAAYQIDPANGRIVLKSVRKLTWDLQMEQFNAQTPLPSELREVQP